MFRKILLCTDLTPASDALIDCVAALKEVGTKEVVLTHVVDVANTPGLDEMTVQDAEPVLERQKQELEKQGVKVELAIPLGVPARTLHEIAEKRDVSVILIGSHGKGMVQAATLGSVSAGLLHLTRRPVLLARTRLLEEGKEGTLCRRIFERVLLPTDFSETSERALDYVGKMALETRCPVTLMHAIEANPDDPADARAREEEAYYLLEAKKRRLQTLGAAQVVIDLVYGKAAQEIVARTGIGDFSLVVMGGQGKGFIEELFLGSTANEVARHAAAPLLFIPTQHFFRSKEGRLGAAENSLSNIPGW